MTKQYIILYNTIFAGFSVIAMIGFTRGAKSARQGESFEIETPYICIIWYHTIFEGFSIIGMIGPARGAKSARHGESLVGGSNDSVFIALHWGKEVSILYTVTWNLLMRGRRWGNPIFWLLNTLLRFNYIHNHVHYIWNMCDFWERLLTIWSRWRLLLQTWIKSPLWN